MNHLAIVDDNESWCFVLSLHLRQQGYVVSTFTDAHAFLREVEQFSLVLIDFSIPTPLYQTSLDGPELICEVKRRFNKPPILVLISSFFTDDLLDRVEDICPEADAILSKQTELNQLLVQIEQLLDRRNPIKAV
jgi:DNA-binding response OmpR family regulator